MSLYLTHPTPVIMLRCLCFEFLSYFPYSVNIVICCLFFTSLLPMFLITCPLFFWLLLHCFCVVSLICFSSVYCFLLVMCFCNQIVSYFSSPSSIYFLVFSSLLCALVFLFIVSILYFLRYLQLLLSYFLLSYLYFLCSLSCLFIPCLLPVIFLLGPVTDSPCSLPQNFNC